MDWEGVEWESSRSFLWGSMACATIAEAGTRGVNPVWRCRPGQPQVPQLPHLLSSRYDTDRRERVELVLANFAAPLSAMADGLDGLVDSGAESAGLGTVIARDHVRGCETKTG